MDSESIILLGFLLFILLFRLLSIIGRKNSIKKNPKKGLAIGIIIAVYLLLTIEYIFPWVIETLELNVMTDKYWIVSLSILLILISYALFRLLVMLIIKKEKD